MSGKIIYCGKNGTGEKFCWKESWLASVTRCFKVFASINDAGIFGAGIHKSFAGFVFEDCDHILQRIWVNFPKFWITIIKYLKN